MTTPLQEYHDFEAFNRRIESQHGDAHSLRTPSAEMGTDSRQLGADGMTYPVAFLQVTFSETTRNAVGGLLVSDNIGVPLEFVITNAVRPTSAQRVLYGKSLRKHVAVELCGRQLLQHVKTRPRVVFVKDDYLLALQKITELPVLQLTTAVQLGSDKPQPTVVAPPLRPENAELIDLRSLDPDMLDAFERIEQCREILARTKDEYRIENCNP